MHLGEMDKLQGTQTLHQIFSKQLKPPETRSPVLKGQSPLQHWEILLLPSSPAERGVQSDRAGMGKRSSLVLDNNTPSEAEEIVG